jgi:MFS family permease
MQLIAPDLYAEVSRLSWGACAIGVVLGVLVWLTGWWQHRFWVVASLTAAAGIFGLRSGRDAGVQPLVAGLLAALAAGHMALELARLLAFVGGGLMSSALMQAFVPTLYEPLLTFLAGGLLAVLLFRLWMLVLTSLIGSVVVGYAAIALAGLWFKVDGTALVAQRVGLLNGLVGAGVLLGVVVQGKFDGWRAGSDKRKKANAMATLSDDERNAIKKLPAKGGLMKYFKPKKAG